MAEIIPFPTHLCRNRVQHVHLESKITTQYNEPTFPRGTQLTIDPCLSPHEYDLVAVNIGATQALVCGSLVQVDEFTFLVPMNPDLSVFSLSEHDELIGVVVNAEAP